MPRRTSKKPSKQLATKGYVDRKLSRVRETKHFDLSQTATAVLQSTAASVQSVAGTVIGTSDVTRIGDTISPTMLHIRGQVGGNTAGNNAQVRIMVVRFAADSAPVAATILENATAGGVSIDSTQAQDEKSNLKVLYDRRFYLSNVAGANKFIQFFNIKIFNSKKRTRMPDIHYAAGTATFEKNGLFLYIFGDQAANQPEVSWYSSLHYKDS